MVNRINLILQAKNITARAFAEEIGAQPSSLSHILSGRNNPSLDFVMKIIRRYPEININWLMFGKGEMYDNAQQSSVPQTANPSDESIDQPSSMSTPVPVNSSVPLEETAVDSPKAEIPVPNSSVEDSPNREYDLFSQPEIPVANNKSGLGSLNLPVESSVAVDAPRDGGESRRPALSDAQQEVPNVATAVSGMYDVEGGNRHAALQGAEGERTVNEQSHGVSNVPSSLGNSKNDTPNPVILEHPIPRRGSGKQIVKVIVFYSDNTFTEL